MKEKQWTVGQVAAEFGLSPQTVIRIFEHEPGVLILERQATAGKRRYRTFRIPDHVFQRVKRALEIPPGG